MRIVTFTEARNGLKRVLDQVANDADCTVITRRDAEDAVVMSLDYYNSLMETVGIRTSACCAASGRCYADLLLSTGSDVYLQHPPK